MALERAASTEEEDPLQAWGPKVFHTRPDLEVNRLYLLALAHADQLQPQEVPHGALVQAYMDMLVAAGVIQPKGRRKRRACEELGDIGLEDDNGDLMLEDAADADPGGKILAALLDDPLGDDLVDEAGDSGDERNPTEPSLADPQSLVPPSLPGAVAVAPHSPALPAQSEGDDPGGGAAAHAVAAPLHALARDAFGNYRSLNFDWGPFKFFLNSAAYHLSVFSAFAPSTQKPAGPGAQKREHCPLLSFQKNTLASSWL